MPLMEDNAVFCPLTELLTIRVPGDCSESAPTHVRIRRFASSRHFVEPLGPLLDILGGGRISSGPRFPVGRVVRMTRT